MTDSQTETFRSKLKDLLNNYQIYYDRKVCDYVFIPLDEVEEKHIKWYEDYLLRENRNENFKNLQERKVRMKKATASNRDKKLKVPLVCEHCGYVYTSVYTGAFQQHHGDKCRFKTTQPEGR